MRASRGKVRAVLTSEGIQGGIRYDYLSPRGRIKPAPTPAEIDHDILKIDAALVEIAARFAIDLSKLDGPAGKPDPIR